LIHPHGSSDGVGATIVYVFPVDVIDAKTLSVHPGSLR